MGLTIEQPETLVGGGNYVDKPGVYHCLITEVDENPAYDDGTPINGIKISLQVLDGTDAAQKDRALDLTFWQSKEKNDMNSRKLTAFCLATSLIGNHAQGQRTTVEPSDAKGRQVVCKLAWKRVKNEATGKYEESNNRVDLHYSDIWHVDDPAVAKANVPLSKECLALIPAQLRKAKPASAPAVSPAALVNGTRSAAGVDLTDV